MSFKPRVLIVDDDTAKTRDIARALLAVKGFDVAAIENVATANDAKRLLRGNTYDLMVLDVALPLRIDQEPDPAGGLKLLAEIVERPQFRRPGHIVGVTAFEEVYREAADRLGQELWSLVFYDPTSERWLEQLQAKARHIRAVEASRETPSVGEYDIAIVTALQDPELDAVLALNWHWSSRPADADSTAYHAGHFTDGHGAVCRIIAARAPTMGMTASAVLATKMAMRFRPRSVVMTGICAGNVDEVQLGDVIVANPSWDYGSGKHAITQEGAKHFAAAPQQARLSTRVRGLVERLQTDRHTLDPIRASFPGSKPPSALSVHLGPLASGAAVLADQDLFDQVKVQHRKLLGVDMEAFAVMAAADEMPAPQPEALVLKGVSDFANAKKDDRFRHYAAYTSARVLAVLVETYGL